jgi:tetratricopeptide (TPR) repeat protein
MRVSKAAVPLFVALFYLSATASAQPRPDQLRATARSLGEEGIALYEKGSYAEALDRFDRADELVHAPTLGLLAARSLEKLGRLVEAAERYRAVMLVQLDEKAPDAFSEAQATASKELEALRPRIPTLEIVVEGADASQSRVTLDGTDVPRAMIGVKTPINPGVHRLEATGPSSSAFKDLNIREKEAARAVLTLASQTPKTVTKDAKPEPDKGSKSGSTRRILGITSLGVGGGLVVLGAVGAANAYALNNRLKDEFGCGTPKPGVCPDRGDQNTERNEVLGAYDGSRVLAGVGIGLGAAGLITGTVLLLTLPKKKSADRASIEPWFGLGSAGLNGTF